MCDIVKDGGSGGDEVVSDEKEQAPLVVQDLIEPGNIARLFKQSDDAIDIIIKLLSDTHVNNMEPRPDGSSLLHSFVMYGCYEVVKILWEKGMRPTILHDDQSTLLHSTVCTHDDIQDDERSNILNFLLSCDECVNNSMPIDHQNSQGWTALKLATRKNLEKCVEVLLSHEANPDLPDCEGYTSLHNAVGNPDILKLLATHSKEIDAPNHDGETSLYLATERGLVESALMLLEYGANPNTPNKEGIVPLFLAARGGHLELVRALVRNNADVNYQGAQQQIAPLHWAAHKEREDIALLLIEHGANILLKDKEDRTPLSMAAPDLAAKMTKAAIQTNPSLCLPSPTTVSPCMSAHNKAMAACCSGNVPALQALHQSGVCVNYHCKQSNSSLLHMAAYCGQLSVVMYLMSRGADWRQRDKEGDTALHYACMKQLPQGQHEKALEYLLTTPLSQLKDAQNINGDTPIMTAIRFKFVNRVKILLQFKVNVELTNHKKELPIHRVCISDNNIEALLYLVELYPDINIPDGDGWTALMYAANSGSAAIVKYLIQRGANPNLRQSAGFSALYLASQEDNVCICKVLLEAGADPNLSGGTQLLSPLHIAAHRGNKKVCMLLVKYGGDIYQEDNDGDTALDLAETAELKQAMLLAHSVSKTQRSLTPQPPQVVVENELTNHIAENNDEDNTITGNGEERSEVTNESSGPDNEWGNGECSIEYESITEHNNNDRGYSNQHMEKCSFDIDGHRNGTLSMEHEDIGIENGRQYSVEQLLKQVNYYQQRLGEMEEEMKTLCIDKELLLCRNRSLEIETTTSCQQQHTDGGQSTPSWLLANSSEYEIIGPQLHNSPRRFFDIYKGTYRDIPVIVKKVHCLDGWNKQLYDLFQDETMKISQLQCPYVVQLLGARISECERVCALVCEQMARGCLYLVLHVDRPHMEWGQRMHIIRDICSGMAFIHSYQVLHRNLLPCNILVGENFNAKISDFGFYELKMKCNFHSKLRSKCTEPQVYMAPEAMEKDEFTKAADVYSFSMIMYEVATGRAPFEDDIKQLSPVLLVMRLLMGKRPTFSSHHNKEYQKIAESCWHSDPNLRPTFSAILPALRELTT